jgi:hypothetical protein
MEAKHPRSSGTTATSGAEECLPQAEYSAISGAENARATSTAPASASSAQTTTRHPREARAFAVSRPSPVLPPVITAVLLCQNTRPRHTHSAGTKGAQKGPCRVRAEACKPTRPAAEIGAVEVEHVPRGRPLTEWSGALLGRCRVLRSRPITACDRHATVAGLMMTVLRSTTWPGERRPTPERDAVGHKCQEEEEPRDHWTMAIGFIRPTHHVSRLLPL